MHTRRLFHLLTSLALGIALIGCGGGTGNSRTASESHLKRLLLLTLTYASENNETFPDLSTADVAKSSLAPTLAKKRSTGSAGEWDESVFVDETSGQAFTPNANLSKVSMAKLDMPMNVIGFYAPAPDGDERLVGYIDGHIEWVKELNWPTKKIGGQAP